jgi:steroid delta-isomerase-like uncharacterized protein
MKNSIVKKFIQALHTADQKGDVHEMTTLFSDDCEISNVAIKPLSGKAGVERFWKEYIATFKQVNTQFTRVEESEGKCVLEWISQGTLQSGRSIAYEGVTLLDFKNDKIQRFKAYHDSAAFLKEGGKHSDVALGPDNVHPISTSKVMEGGPRREISTPGEGVLTSTLKDRDAATG